MRSLASLVFGIIERAAAAHGTAILRSRSLRCEDVRFRRHDDMFSGIGSAMTSAKRTVRIAATP